MRIRQPLDDLFGNPNNVKVLRHLTLYPSPVISGRGIARELEMSHATCIRSLNDLVDSGILTRKKVGNSATYELAASSVVVTDILEPAFRVEARLLSGLVDTMLKGIRKKVQSAYLFGSVARGEDTRSSDVDILLILNQPADRPMVEENLARNKEQAYLKYRLGVSIVAYDRNQFDKMRRQKNPLVTEMMREGVLLFGREVR